MSHEFINLDDVIKTGQALVDAGIAMFDKVQEKSQEETSIQDMLGVMLSGIQAAERLMDEARILENKYPAAAWIISIGTSKAISPLLYRLRELKAIEDSRRESN